MTLTNELKVPIYGLLIIILIWFVAGLLIMNMFNSLKKNSDCEFDVLVDQKFNYMRVDNVTGAAGFVQGYYSNPDYFCVKTKGRSFEAIAETTYHELAHHYAEKEERHFCGVD